MHQQFRVVKNCKHDYKSVFDQTWKTSIDVVCWRKSLQFWSTHPYHLPGSPAWLSSPWGCSFPRRCCRPKLWQLPRRHSHRLRRHHRRRPKSCRCCCRTGLVTIISKLKFCWITKGIFQLSKILDMFQISHFNAIYMCNSCPQKCNIIHMWNWKDFSWGFCRAEHYVIRVSFIGGQRGGSAEGSPPYL